MTDNLYWFISDAMNCQWRLIS